jgi:hypothetical protein
MAARIIAVVSAACSLGFMLYAGRHNPSVLLLVLFTGWVLSPFIALFVVDAVSRRWTIAARKAVSIFMMLIAMGSVTAYAYDAVRPGRTKAAAIFLVVPFVSWFIIAVVVARVAFRSGKSR